ncbi:GTPase IMAP family member 9-like [Archocentrus centrarchus]|uniref:GTPase IMAP family member 9-like n=1 Tax=Archocentrus centrarchus TaxID=63155 RepID=UPI0011E9FCB9|nr:GTPase IMAP family member 9-like [Archocentrus centrarchus]
MDGDNTSETKILIDQDPQTMADAEKLPELRIVLFGKTTRGKSTLGDIIMGNTKAFTSKDTDDLTKKCHVERRTIEEQSVVVVDTPGLFKEQTEKPSETLLRTIRKSVDLAKPGPHVFLLFERLKEITREELEILQVFERTFGKRAMAYAMVVFTHDDDGNAERAKTEEWIKKHELNELFEPCQGRHFFFNINNRSPTQVSELLKVIRQTGTQYYYTPEMLKEHEKEEAEKEEAEKKRNQEQQGNNPKPAETENKAKFLEKSGLIGIIVGCGLGYFIGGGGLNPTSGALLGAVAGMILSMGTTALGMKAKMLFDNFCKA